MFTRMQKLFLLLVSIMFIIPTMGATNMKTNDDATTISSEDKNTICVVFENTIRDICEFSNGVSSDVNDSMSILTSVTEKNHFDCYSVAMFTVPPYGEIIADQSISENTWMLSNECLNESMPHYSKAAIYVSEGNIDLTSGVSLDAMLQGTSWFYKSSQSYELMTQRCPEVYLIYFDFDLNYYNPDACELTSRTEVIAIRDGLDLVSWMFNDSNPGVLKPPLQNTEIDPVSNDLSSDLNTGSSNNAFNQDDVISIETSHFQNSNWSDAKKIANRIDAENVNLSNNHITRDAATQVYNNCSNDAKISILITSGETSHFQNSNCNEDVIDVVTMARMNVENGIMDSDCVLSAYQTSWCKDGSYGEVLSSFP